MSKAFTLIELLVVMAIISVMVGASFVALKLMSPSMKLLSTAQDVASDLRYAQQLAVTEQIKYGILFSTSTQSYQLLKHSTTTAQVFNKSLPGGITLSSVGGLTGSEALFNAYGAAQDDGSIVLRNDKGEEKTVEVRPSGFVKMQ